MHTRGVGSNPSGPTLAHKRRPARVGDNAPIASVPGARTMSSISARSSYVFAAACPDQPGIVAAVSGFLAERRLNILDADQFNDHVNGRFFIRVHFTELGDPYDPARLRAELSPLVSRFDMSWSLHHTSERPRLL